MKQPTRQDILSIYDGIELYADISGLTVDMQGWNSESPMIREVIQRVRPAIVAEVGVWKGAGTVHMAKLCKELGLQTKFYAIDAWIGPSTAEINALPESQVPVRWSKASLYQQFIYNIHRSGFSDRIIPVWQFSRHGAAMLAHWQVRPNVIYIDACHDEDFAYADMISYWPVLAEGGIICGDDWSDSYPGVKKAATRMAELVSRTLNIRDGHWFLDPK